MAREFLPDSRKQSDYEGSVLRVPHQYLRFHYFYLYEFQANWMAGPSGTGIFYITPKG